MSQPTIDEIANAMFELVKTTYGKKNLKPMDLMKAMIEDFGEEECDKKMCKLANRQQIDSVRCIYRYVVGSFITLPAEGVPATG
jgi:hypothetical protein